MLCDKPGTSSVFCSNDASDDQDSTGWLEWRQKGIGSSDAVIIAGLSPWKTIFDLWSDKMGLTPKQEPNWAMLRGKELEPVARDIYEFNYHISVPAKNFIHPDYKWAKASVDGWSDEHKFIVEFKAPGKKDLVLAQSGQMPDKYYPQVQWQMFVTNANFCDYVTYDGKADIYVKRVFSDKKYQRKLFLLARWFWAKVEAQSEIRREPRCLKKTI